MTWGGRVEGSVRRGRGSDMGWESRREREERQRRK